MYIIYILYIYILYIHIYCTYKSQWIDQFKIKTLQSQKYPRCFFPPRKPRKLLGAGHADDGALVSEVGLARRMEGVQDGVGRGEGRTPAST